VDACGVAVMQTSVADEFFYCGWRIAASSV